MPNTKDKVISIRNVVYKKLSELTESEKAIYDAGFGDGFRSPRHITTILVLLVIIFIVIFAKK